LNKNLANIIQYFYKEDIMNDPENNASNFLKKLHKMKENNPI